MNREELKDIIYELRMKLYRNEIRSGYCPWSMGILQNKDKDEIDCDTIECDDCTNDFHDKLGIQVRDWVDEL